MESVIQELEQKIRRMKKGHLLTHDKEIARILREAIARAEQTLAKFRAVERCMSSKESGLVVRGGFVGSS